MKDSIPKAIPYVLVGYFGISLVYNFVYFYMLGIDMRKIPFSWIDYTMSVSFIGPQMLYYAFIFSCGIIVAILFRKDGCCSGKTAKYSRKMIVFISMMVIVIIISAVKNYLQLCLSLKVFLRVMLYVVLRWHGLRHVLFSVHPIRPR